MKTLKEESRFTGYISHIVLGGEVMLKVDDVDNRDIKYLLTKRYLEDIHITESSQLGNDIMK